MPELAIQTNIFSRFRKVENAHIALWLIKDTCWATFWKLGGILMIFPTLTVAFFLLWKLRSLRSEFFHNLAVCIWILANSAWMLGEFFGKETRPLAVSLFAVGLGILGYFHFLNLFSFKQTTVSQVESKSIDNSILEE
ncbi:MAG: hypothetical protein JST52_07540 [Bacteroidetes bacterium]|nr:hypothetical protein [Bacteroidota bacterium]MBS1739060.1 hypothetical protein [Bacteroidota bacterium]